MASNTRSFPSWMGKEVVIPPGELAVPVTNGTVKASNEQRLERRSSSLNHKGQSESRKGQSVETKSAASNVGSVSRGWGADNACCYECAAFRCAGISSPDVPHAYAGAD